MPFCFPKAGPRSAASRPRAAGFQRGQLSPARLLTVRPGVASDIGPSHALPAASSAPTAWRSPSKTGSGYEGRAFAGGAGLSCSGGRVCGRTAAGWYRGRRPHTNLSRGNLAPAELKKDAGAFDLPIAAALLVSTGRRLL